VRQADKILTGFGLAIVSLWDCYTTFYGTHRIAGDSPTQFGISIAFGIGLSIGMLRSVPILKNPNEDVFAVSAKAMWFLALIYDLYTAFLGNFYLLLASVNDNSKIILANGLTIFTVYAPICLSRIIYSTEN